MDVLQTRLVTTKELAHLIGKCPGALANDRALNRGLPYYKVGYTIRYDVDECLQLTRVVPGRGKEGSAA